jgi:hypothetical protein
MNWHREKWRKLYVREEGTFAQLPLFARALAAEILKLVDDAGVIEIGGGRTFEEVVAWRLGATRGDRRLLSQMLPLLFADRYITQVENRVQVVNFGAAQGRREVSRSGDEAVTTVERAGNGVATAAQPTNNETRTKIPEPFDSPRVVERRGEEKREEEKEDGGTGSKSPDPPAPDFVLVFQTVGGKKNDAKTWGLTVSMLAALQEAFPGISVLGEAKKAHLWTEANKVNRKTADGMFEFLRRWMSRETNDKARKPQWVLDKETARPAAPYHAPAKPVAADWSKVAPWPKEAKGSP